MAFELRPLGEKEDVSLYLQNAFRELEEELRRELSIKPLFTAPPINPEEGEIVRADGTEWDPGSGGGFYGYHNGNWVFLG